MYEAVFGKSAITSNRTIDGALNVRFQWERSGRYYRARIDAKPFSIQSSITDCIDADSRESGGCHDADLIPRD